MLEPSDSLEKKEVSNFIIKWESVQIRETLNNPKKNFIDNNGLEYKVFDNNNHKDSSISEEMFVKEESIDFS